MSWLQFIDSMVGRLAWPIVALVVLFAIRKQLSSMAERILELSFGGATVKFDKLLAKGAELIEEVPTPPQPEAELQELPRSGMYDVPSSYAVVEKELVLVAPYLGVEPEFTHAVIAELRKRGLIEDELFDLHRTLWTGRNSVVVGQYTLSREEEKEYARQALFLALRLASVRRKLEKEKAPPKREP